MRPITPRLGPAFILLSVLIHASVAFAILFNPAPPQSQSGGGALSIALGPPGGATPTEAAPDRPREPDPLEQPVAPPEPVVEDAVPLEQTKKPEPRPEPPEKKPEPKPKQEVVPSAPQPEQTQSVQGRTGAATQKAPIAGVNETPAIGFDVAGMRRDYAAELLAWLSRHKQYPRRARLRGLEGTAQLYLELDSRGNVLSHRLERSSRHGMLDEAVLEMLERAKPLPAPPPDLADQRLAFVIPVTFEIRSR